jgi:hypothetical protein
MRLFRRKPDPDALLRGLREIARDLAQQVYELPRNAPGTLSHAEVTEVAARICEPIARECIAKSKNKDIGAAAAALIYGDTFDTFSNRYIELTRGL